MVRSLCVAFLSFAILLLLTTPSECITVTVDPDIKFQQFEGWGTSLCWWAVSAGKWDESNRNKLINAIVDQDTGLGYNCFRYNIGGGDQPGHTHLAEARAVPGFKKSETSPYDWTADQYQRNILLGIAEKRKDLIFEAFSNSPPWWMTISGCVSGNTNGADNLKSTHFTAFADYLASVVKYYKENWGITFRTVTPFNEPSSGYWKTNGGQEGCGFKSQQSRMVKELGKQLVIKDLFTNTKISAADETSLEHTVNAFKSYDDSAFSFLSQINSHSYGGWPFRKAVDSLARSHKKILWQSESGPLGKSDKDLSDITMWMSHVIIQDLRVMKANAWLDWQVGDPVGDWMTIELNHAKQSFKYTKRYYMHAAFSRFIRPGSLIINSSDTNSVAALVPGTGNLVVVLRNNANTENKYIIDLSKFKTLGTNAHIYRFTLPGSLNKLTDIVVSNKQVSFSAPGQSITTCLIPISETSNKQTGKVFIPERNQLKFTDVFNSQIRFSLVSNAPYTLSIYSSTGRKVLYIQDVPNSTDNSIDLHKYSLAKGMYLAQLTQNGMTFSRNVILFSHQVQ
jgi:O-glycosyl hydrolase